MAKRFAGLRFPDELIESVVAGVMHMEESSVYQAILRRGVAKGRAEGQAEGRAQEARAILLRICTHRFGPPSADILSKLHATSDVEQLEQLADRVWQASSWEELLNLSK